MVTCPKCGKKANVSLNLTKGNHNITATMEEATIESEVVILEIECSNCKTLFAYTTVLDETFMFANEIKNFV